MSEKKTINTRLVLRNADLTAWNASDVALLQGEVALAKRDGGSYEIRVGTGDKTWSQLSSSGQLMIPSKNVDNLTYDEYRLSSLGSSEGKQARFQLQGKNSSTQVWGDIGDPIEIPEVDFGPVNAKISALSDAIDTINDTTIPAVKTELSGALSTYTDTQVKAAKEELSGYVDTKAEETLTSAKGYTDEVSAATKTYIDTEITSAVDAAKTELKGDSSSLSSSTTIEGAKRYADQKASDALKSSKDYTDQVSAFLSADYQDKYDDILAKIKDGIHFIGKVYEIGVTEGAGWYQKVSGGQKFPAANGDLVIKAGVEYVYSETDAEWVQLGDEGTWASKAYVDTAKSEAISATTNIVKHFTSKDDIALSANYGKNCGDIAIVKEKVADSADTTDGEDKYEYTAYVWDTALAGDNKWTAMDGNYNAENVYFKENIIKAGTWTSVGNVTHTANTVQTLTSKGKNVMEVMEMIMKGDELFPTQAKDNKPSLAISFNGSQVEYGTTVTPTFTITLDPRTYTYGSNSNTSNGSKTGISALNWTIDYTKYDGTAGEQLTGNWNTQLKTGSASATKSIAQIVLTSTYSAKNLTAYGAWAAAPDGTYIPRSNLQRTLSSDSETAKYRTADGSATTSTRGGNDFTVKYPRYYKFTTSIEDVPTTFSASSYSGWTREYSNKSSFTTSKSWYQLFYLEPADQGHTTWTGKDSNNITLNVVNPAVNVEMTYINGDTGAYKLFVVTNAAIYSATTCTMTLA